MSPLARDVASSRTIGAKKRRARPTDLERLWARYQRLGGDEERNRLVEHYQGLVREVVRRFAARLPRSVERGDLETAGSVGLMSAIESFDPSRGVRFESYGEMRVRGALLDELRTQDWLPRPWRHRMERHKRVREELRAKLDREPSDDECARALGLSSEEYRQIFGGVLRSPPVAVGEGDDEHGYGLDVVVDPDPDAPGEKLSREELLRLVAQKLTEQEYRIVYLKYWEELPMREIGQLEGLSESRVCKIHQRLLERLKDRFRANAVD